MEDCLFCKIVKGDIPSEKVYEDGNVYAFRDINPQAPTHILIIPKAHMTDALDCAEKGGAVMADMLKAAAAIAKAEGIDGSGFRLVSNCGADASQSVSHFHVHLLGGKALTLTMG